MNQGTQSQCCGTTQWDRVGREGGGGFRIRVGKHVYLWLIHVDVWQKPSQYCKVIILQLKLINFFRKDMKNDGSWQKKWSWKQPWQRGQPQ